MGVNRLFIPQTVLDEWVDEGRAELDGDRLELRGEGSFRLEPAVHFLREATGQDPRELAGRVKPAGVVAALGAETYMDSVVLEDSAYDVHPGFFALPEVLLEASPAPDPGAVPTEPSETGDREQRPGTRSKDRRPGGDESDELAELLLKHLK